MRSFVARLRKGVSGMARPPKRGKHGEAVSAVSPRELRWLVSKREEDLTRGANSKTRCGFWRALEAGEGTRLFAPVVS